MDGLGWGVGDDGLRRSWKRKQVGSHQTVLWQIQSQCWCRSWSWWCNKLPGTCKFHFHFGTAAQPGHVANLDGSKLDGTAGSSPKLAGQACARGPTSHPANQAHLFNLRGTKPGGAYVSGGPGISIPPAHASCLSSMKYRVHSSRDGTWTSTPDYCSIFTKEWFEK